MHHLKISSYALQSCKQAVAFQGLLWNADDPWKEKEKENFCIHCSNSAIVGENDYCPF